MTRETGRIPSLDGLRGISILLVLAGHLAGTRGFPLSESIGNDLSLAEVGVHVFFVISGFLITGLLLSELASTNDVRLGRFYFRRRSVFSLRTTHWSSRYSSRTALGSSRWHPVTPP